MGFIVLQGLSSDAHNRMDASAFYKPLLKKANHVSFPTVWDFGTGGGRDIVRLRDSCEFGAGRFYGVDRSPERAQDAIRNFGHVVEVTDSIDKLPAIANRRKIGYLLHDLLSLNLPDYLKGDLGLCLALAMFIEPEDLDDYASSLLRNMKPGGYIAHYHSIWRPEKEGYPAGHYFHNVSDLKVLFQSHGAHVEDLEPVPDAADRGFDWYGLGITTPTPIT